MTEKGETSNTNAVGDTGVLLFPAHRGGIALVGNQSYRRGE